jgi:hypothetical protein
MEDVLLGTLSDSMLGLEWYKELYTVLIVADDESVVTDK